MNQTVSFTVQFTVDQSWIDDGFILDNEKALNMLSNALPYAYPHELQATVVSMKVKA